MPIRIRFQDGADAGKELPAFDDKVERIVIGRDPDLCQVTFPADNRVGREHCTFERRAGRYRVRINQEDVVLCDGKRMFDNEQLPFDRDCKLQLGSPGPTLIVRTWLAGEGTIGQQPQPDVPDQVIWQGHWLRILLWTSLAALILFAVALGIGTRLSWNWANHVTAAFTGGIADLNKKTEILGKKTEDLAKQQMELSDAASEVQSALMLIGFAGDPKVPNSKSAMATGFVISLDKRLVATNAHVADLLGSAQQLYAIPNGRTETYEVDTAYYHPGAVRISPEGLRKRSNSPGDGEVDQFSADVAILHLKDDGNGFPKGVTQVVLATPQEIQKLSNLSVGMYGYPGEATNFPSDGKVLSADNRDGNINRVTGFDGTTDKNPGNNQLLAYTMSTEAGFSGSPVFLKNGHVVAINNSHHEEGGNRQAYGIRIDCLWELLLKPELAKLMPPPKVWDQGEVPAHTDPTVPIDPASAWEAVSSLQAAQMLDKPGEPTATVLTFEQKENVCNDAVGKAEQFPFVYMARGRLYGEKSADKQLSQQQMGDYLDKARANFNMALQKDLRRAPPLDPKLFEAKLWLCRIDNVKAGLPSPGTIREASTIIGEIDQIVNDKTPLTKRLEALAWRIRARCHWTRPEAAMDLDKAVKTLPQLPENLLLRADYYDENSSSPRPDAAKDDRTQAVLIPQAIAKAYTALNQAKQWAAGPHPAGDTSGMDTANKQGLEAVNQTFNQEWNCLDCYANIRAIGGDSTAAVRTALQAGQWAPDATQKFRSEEDVYEFRGPAHR